MNYYIFFIIFTLIINKNIGLNLAINLVKFIYFFITNIRLKIIAEYIRNNLFGNFSPKHIKYVLDYDIYTYI